MPKLINILFVLALSLLFFSPSTTLAKDNVSDKVKNATKKTTATKATLQKAIDINAASAETLAQIKGIGPKLAERIVDFRKKTGKFKSVEDLLEIKGIGEKKLKAMKPFIKLK